MSTSTPGLPPEGKGQELCALEALPQASLSVSHRGAPDGGEPRSVLRTVSLDDVDRRTARPTRLGEALGHGERGGATVSLDGESSDALDALTPPRPGFEFGEEARTLEGGGATRLHLREREQEPIARGRREEDARSAERHRLHTELELGRRYEGVDDGVAAHRRQVVDEGEAGTALERHVDEGEVGLLVFPRREGLGHARREVERMLFRGTRSFDRPQDGDVVDSGQYA